MTLDIVGEFPGFADDHVAINVEGPLEGNERSRVGICILLRIVGISINDAHVPIQTAPVSRTYHPHTWGTLNIALYDLNIRTSRVGELHNSGL